MLFIVIEHFKDGDATAAGERFRRQGRMLPPNVTYHSSWIETSGARCYQLMEAPDESALKTWTAHWNDLVDFEIVPVLTSSEFWSRRLTNSK